ncbi:MAG: signaling protein [Hydrogenophilales bacterium 12-61-10]|nr:MAG: signaling protein [Hydrogenophilales bacterium 12-61-10]
MRKLCSTPILAVALAILLSGCANGYQAFYKQAQGATPEAVAAKRAAPPPPIPAVERAQPGNSQETQDAYWKRGYAIIGNSMFNSGRPVSEDSAVRQAQDVGADLVLILNPQYTGTVTSSVPITTPTTTTSYSTGTATAYGYGGSATAYGSGTTTTYGTTTNYIPMTLNRSDYGAVYFVKQRFDLGLVTRDLNDAERQELQTDRGAAVRLVVDGTPAFNADMLVGDVITTIDGVAVPGAKVFNELLSERRGKLIALALIRRGQRIEKSVQLNP